MNTKDAIEERNRSGIYEIKCQDGCAAEYVGQSRRKIAVRFGEHMAHFRRQETERSSVADHLLEEGHFTYVLKLKLLRQGNRQEQLDMLESIEIAKKKTNQMLLNSDGGPITSVLTRLFEK